MYVADHSEEIVAFLCLGSVMIAYLWAIWRFFKSLFDESREKPGTTPRGFDVQLLVRKEDANSDTKSD